MGRSSHGQRVAVQNLCSLGLLAPGLLMAFHLPSCQNPLPPPPGLWQELLEVAASALQGPPSSALFLAEVFARRRAGLHSQGSGKERRAYLPATPVAVVGQAPAGRILDARPPSTAWAVLIAGSIPQPPTFQAIVVLQAGEAAGSP